MLFIKKFLGAIVPLIRDYFFDRRKYFAHFCLKLATQIVNKFLGSIFKCKPLTVAATEQLLLDTHSLKTFLLNLPSVGSSVVVKPPSLFTAAVNEVMTKAEMVLKASMSLDTTRPENFIVDYARMLPQSNSNELQKILEMRGALKRSEITNLVQLYRTKIEGIAEPKTTNATSSMPSAFSAIASLASDSLSESSMSRLEKLVKRKL